MIPKAKISQILCIFFVFVSSCHALSSRVSLHFEANLYSNIDAEHRGENIFYSPLSIETCLAMTRMGADGETANEIDKAMTGSGQKRTELEQSYFEILKEYQKSRILKIANKIYHMKGFGIKKSFYNSLTKKFLAEIAGLNFTKSSGSAKAINSWVEKQTNNTIRNLISKDKLSGDTPLVLVNAVYFKGEWASEFNKSLTTTKPFYLADNSTFDVQMMFQKNQLEFANIQNLKAYALNMPYKNSNFSMLILLPYTNAHLSDIEKSLKTYPFSKIFDKLNYNKNTYGLDDVDVFLPRFKYEFEVDLKNPLNNMGIQRMFSSNAEFNNMLKPSKDLYVSSIVHKAFIEVNEAGATAAAATAATFSDRSSGLTFEVNRPFKFFIVDMKTYEKIFEGRFNSKFTS